MNASVRYDYYRRLLVVVIAYSLLYNNDECEAGLALAPSQLQCKSNFNAHFEHCNQLNSTVSKPRARTWYFRSLVGASRSVAILPFLRNIFATKYHHKHSAGYKFNKLL